MYDLTFYMRINFLLLTFVLESINMATLMRAIQIATEAHGRQKDKAGMPYITHVLRVMEKGHTETEKICGVLHDLIEDTDWTFEDLEKEGFSNEIVLTLRHLTHQENEPYKAYIDRVAQDPIAIRIKINDLTDNMDIRRLKEISEADVRRLQKYLKTYQKLVQLL